MNVFSSLGSNYNFNFVLKALFANNRETYKEKLINFLEKKYGGRPILVYKGREAIGLALEILDLPKESAVAINGFTCFAVYKAVQTTGYKPLCLDLDNNLDLNFSASKLSKAIKQNPKIKVVIIQNTLGYPCDIEKIAKTCRENNLVLIEDLAHCVGTKYKNGKEAGTIGDFVVLSFSQDKIIDAVSGGALVIRNKKYHLASQGDALRSNEVGGKTPRRWPKDSFEVDNNNGTMEQWNNDGSRQARTINLQTLGLKDQLIDRLYPLFTFIIRKTYQTGIGKFIHFILKSLNLLSKPMNESFYAEYDLPSWYAYLVIEAFENLNNNLKHRNEIASIYSSMLSSKITNQDINKNIHLSSNLRYPIFVENRKSLIGYLKKEGIYVSDIWYDSVDNSLKNAKIASDTILNLPTHINVSEKDAKRLAQKINQFFRHYPSP